jgi:hypothetical protein
VDAHLTAVTAARDEARELVAVKLRRREELDAEISDLQAEVDGFNRYLARHGGEDTSAPSPAGASTPAEDRPVDRWREMKRTDAAVEALGVIGKPASPREIAGQLRRFGRSDDMRQVSRVLDRLKEQGRVRSAGWGQWLPAGPDAPDAQEESKDVSEAEPRLPLPEPPSPNGMGRPPVEAVV